jgi:hypothetical protein
MPQKQARNEIKMVFVYLFIYLLNIKEACGPTGGVAKGMFLVGTITCELHGFGCGLL